MTKLNRNKMANKLTTKNGIIIRQDRLVYSQPCPCSALALGNINSSIQIAIQGESTSFTLDETSMSDSFNIMTPTASFRSVSRIDIDYPNSLSQGLIFNKTLELSESPFVNPLVVSGSCSDSSQVFHNNTISFIQTINDLSTDIVISPSHQPCPTSTHSLELSSGSLRAFSLELTHKFIMLDSFLFNIFSIEPPFTTHNEIINSHVESENSMCLRAPFLDMRECEHKECSIKFINQQETLADFPIFKIDLEAFRNLNIKLLPSFDSRYTQDIIFKGSRARKVVTHRSSTNNRFSSGSLNHATSLFDTSDRKLRRQTHLPQISINKRMKFNIISNSHFPSSVYTMLQGFGIQTNSLFNLWNCFDFNLGSCSQTHDNYGNSNYLNISEADNSSPKLIEGFPCLKNK